MRFMHWGWRDYCELPSFYRDVLIEVIQDEVRETRRQQDRAERRTRMAK